MKLNAYASVLLSLSCLVSTAAIAGRIHAAIIAKKRMPDLVIEIRKEDDLDEKEDGMAPIHLATKYGFLDDVKKLLRFGASVDILSGENQTAAQIALENNDSEILAVLLGAD